MAVTTITTIGNQLLGNAGENMEKEKTTDATMNIDVQILKCNIETISDKEKLEADNDDLASSKVEALFQEFCESKITL